LSDKFGGWAKSFALSEPQREQHFVVHRSGRIRGIIFRNGRRRCEGEGGAGLAVRRIKVDGSATVRVRTVVREKFPLSVVYLTTDL
jgi:hypothetical protein